MVVFYNPLALQSFQPGWQDLAAFKPQSEVQDRIKSLGNGWKLQSLLDNTAAPSINMDYFPVKITSMPFKNIETQEKFTPEELFQHFRKNINSFFMNPNSEFIPLTPQDATLWSSNNPLKTVFTIDIKPIFGSSNFGDDGSVIRSQAESCCWIFSTLKAPAFPLKYDGLHPVAGNRQFGYTYSNGTMTMFSKGLDRFYIPIDYVNLAFPCEPSTIIVNNIKHVVGYMLEGLAYQGGDDLWEAFQFGAIDWVQTRGGAAIYEAPIKKRPAANETLKTLLKGTTKITSIPCGG